MARLSHTVAAIVIAGTLGSCRSATDAPPELPLVFALGDFGTPAYAGPQVSTAPGLLRISARILTGTPCYDLRARAFRRGNTIEVTVTATGQNVPCVSMLGGFAYEATLRNLAPGAYHVLLRHVNDISALPAHERTLFSGDVTVP